MLPPSRERLTQDPYFDKRIAGFIDTKSVMRKSISQQNISPQKKAGLLPAQCFLGLDLLNYFVCDF